MKNNSKKTLAIVTLAALLLTSFGKVGHATVVSGAKGSTDVSVNLSGIIILHYISGITLDFETLSEGIDEGSSGTWDVTWADGEASGGTGLTTGTLTSSAVSESDGSITVHIPNVWAVRGISSSGNAEVSIALTTPTITNATPASSATITITQAELQQASNEGTNIEVQLGGILKSQARIGDVSLTLDMSSANATGSYTGGVYTITAEAV